jgi:threonine dehydratase
MREFSEDRSIQDPWWNECSIIIVLRKKKKRDRHSFIGNHAQAIAYAAKAVGVKAFIVMPDNSPKVKVDAVKGYGAEIFFCEPNQQAREKTLQEVVDKTGAEFIHPYTIIMK